MLGLLNKKSIGIDIADHTIEVVELEKKGGKPQVVNLGRIKLESGIVENGRIIDEESLTKAVKDVLAQAKPNPIEADEIIFGLPESQVYTHIFILEPHGAEERESLIEQEAKTSIPLKEDNLLFSYKILFEDSEKVVVLLSAASKEAATEWQKFWQKLDIKIEFFDLEILATFRGLFPKTIKEPVCVVDMGAATTMISVFDKKGLHYSYSFNVAGQVITDLIKKAKNITAEEAEKLKREKGLDNSDEELKNTIFDKLKLIAKEIKVAIKYSKEQFGIEVKEVVLVGGTSQLKGLVGYFKSETGLPARLGESGLSGDKRLHSHHPVLGLYVEAIGLALRGMDKKWENDPAILLAEEKKNIKKAKEVKIPKKIKNINIEPDKKLRQQKITLLIIGIVGIIAIGLAFWYRKIDESKLAEDRQAKMVQYTQVQSFALKVPVAINPEEYTADRARGRVVEQIVESADGYVDAANIARFDAEKKLENNEILWTVPINEPENKEAIKFPITIQWLVYSDEDADSLLLKKVDKLNKNNINYILNKIEKDNIEATDNPDIYSLNGVVAVSLNQLIETQLAPAGENNEIEVEKQIARVVIKGETGDQLNVRAGAGFNYSVLTKINAGESYPLLSEENNWYEIEFSTGESGWISAGYAEKQ